MTMTGILLMALTGACSGVMAGLLGVGGGLIIVPALVAILPALGVPAEHLMHAAVASSLATILLTSLSSVRAHHGHGAVLWPVFWRLAPGIALGAALGAQLADALPSAGLKQVFGVFALVVAAQMALGLQAKARHALPGTLATTVIGLLMGGISGIVGIGGGSLVVPFLSGCSVPMPKAVGTSSACGLPIAAGGAAGAVLAGWSAQGMPAGSLGYVYAPALVVVGLVSVLTAPLGARWSHRLPVTVLKKVFAGFLALVGAKMLLF
ncbi:MAG: sulfite exporter TauE/SafE family protein [Gammaproteobacteria bacterium]|nr:sulfite exporter TauE/SafE family protein [Gammaproteobacteria bacterium]